jgi:anti-anti-sigma factor
MLMTSLKPAESRWSIPRSDSAAAGPIREAVAFLTSQAGISEKAAFPYTLCLREAVSNAIRHGNPFSPEDRVDLTVKTDCTAVEYTISCPASRLAFHHALTRPDPDRESGRGFAILRRYSLAIRLSPDGTTLGLKLPLYEKNADDQPATAINPPTMKSVQQGSRLSLIPQKDLTAESVPGLRQAIRDELADEIDAVDLNLEDVGVVDSSGIGLVIALHNSLQKRGASLRVINASPDIEDLFKSMRLDRQFSVSSESP